MRHLYLGLSPDRYREAAERLAAAERRLVTQPGDDTNLRYARALTGWEDIGGYDLAVVGRPAPPGPWVCPGRRWPTAPSAPSVGASASGWPLSSCSAPSTRSSLLDEPDNFLDIPHKEWLADEIRRSAKTILFVSHDRELLADAAQKVVTLEAAGAWTHGGSFAGWAEARDARRARIDDEHRRWADERKRLVEHYADS